MSEITSFQNPRFKRVRKLHESRHRRKLGLFLIEGVRPLRLALENRFRIQEVFVCQGHPLCPAARELLLELDRRGVPLAEVRRGVFRQMLIGQRNEGLVAVVHTPKRTLESMPLEERPLVVVLQGVEKPGNVGAVFRSADAAGASAVVLADPRTDLFNPHAIHASLGAVLTMPCAVATSQEVKHYLQQHHLACYAARVDAPREYTQVDWTAPAAVVLGSEAQGLSPLWLGEDVPGVRLPMQGQVDSLNVSVTAAVILYEALRQRQALGGNEGAD